MGQSPRSMGFSRQEYWSGLPFPPSGIFLPQGSNLCPLHLFQWQTDSLPLSHMGSPKVTDQGPERPGGWATGGGHGGGGAVRSRGGTCMAHTPAPPQDTEDHSASPATRQILCAHAAAAKFQTKGHQRSFCKGPDKHLEPFSHTHILLHILLLIIIIIFTTL